jgi:hypothetical protein
MFRVHGGRFRLSHMWLERCGRRVFLHRRRLCQQEILERRRLQVLLRRENRLFCGDRFLSRDWLLGHNWFVRGN